VRVALATFWLKLLKKLRAVLRHFYFVWELDFPSFSPFPTLFVFCPFVKENDTSQRRGNFTYYPKREKDSEDSAGPTDSENNRKSKEQKWLLFHTRLASSPPPPLASQMSCGLRSHEFGGLGVDGRGRDCSDFPRVWCADDSSPSPLTPPPAWGRSYRAPEHNSRSETR